MNSRETATAKLANCDLPALLPPLRGSPLGGLSPAGLRPQLYAASASRLEIDAHNFEQLPPERGAIGETLWVV